MASSTAAESLAARTTPSGLEMQSSSSARRLSSLAQHDDQDSHDDRDKVNAAPIARHCAHGPHASVTSYTALGSCHADRYVHAHISGMGASAVCCLGRYSMRGCAIQRVKQQQLTAAPTAVDQARRGSLQSPTLLTTHILQNLPPANPYVPPA